MNRRMLAGLTMLVAACGAATGDAGGTSLTVVDATVPAPSTTLPGEDPAPTSTLPEDDPSPTAPTSPTGIVGPVFIDSTEILYLESLPVQVRLVVRGSLPSPCHEVQWSVDDLGWSIDVQLWSVILLGQDCAQVLEPFDESIPLGSYERASLPVVVNGESIGRISVGAEPVSGGLVGAGWSFGMCGGFCRADLAIGDAELVLTGRGWAGEEPLFQNRGVLTSTGLERLGAALARLGETALDSVYGCPDCADGGAAHLVIERQGTTSRHDMEFGEPPEELADLYWLATGMIDALETCESDHLVTVADDCQAWRGF